MARKRKAVKKAAKSEGVDPKEYFTAAIESKFSDLPEERVEQTIEILTSIVATRNAKPEDVVKTLQEKLDATSSNAPAEDRYASALVSTRRIFKRGGRRPAVDVIGIIIGKQNRVENNGKRRIAELDEEYKEEKAPDDVEIELQEYLKVMKRAKKFKDDQDEEKSKFLQDKFDGAYFVFDDAEKEDDFFIENLHTWDNGSINFGYGEKLVDLPQMEFTLLLKEGKKWRRQDVRIKGQESIDILRDGQMFWPLTAKVVTQKDTRWWNDQKSANFNLTPHSEEAALKFIGVNNAGEVEAKMFSLFKEGFEKAEKVTVDKIDSWQRKRKSDKKSTMALINGRVDNIYPKDNGGHSITMVSNKINIFDAFKLGDEGDDETEQVEFRIAVNEEQSKLIDFDIDTKLFIYTDVYRGKAWDSDKGEQLDKDADMPSGNSWGFFADPSLKAKRPSPNDVSEEDLDVESEEEDSEEDDFEIED